MKRLLLSVALTAAMFLGTGATMAAGFTYHGSLQDAGKPANGSYDIELTLYSASTGGSVVGGPLTIYAVPVHDGSFSAEADFGPLAKSFSQAYVDVKMRTAGNGDFATLDAREAVSVSAATSCPGSWDLLGNAGNPAGSFLGTADAQPLVFKVNSVQAGQITPGKGVWFSQAGCLGVGLCLTPTANGTDSFAFGESTSAGGAESFAGGFGVSAAQAGSFMWGDSQGNTSGGITTTTAKDQFIVRSAGGVGINGAPKDNATELTIYPSAVNGGNYPSIFLGNTGRTGGILIGSGDESTATSNDAGFYIDQYNGTTQTRRLAIGPNGDVGINTVNGPVGNEPMAADLTLRSSSGGASATKIDMLAQTPGDPHLGMSIISNPGGIFALHGLTTNSGSLKVLDITVLDAGSGKSDSKFSFNNVSLSQTSPTIVVGTSTSNGNGASLTNGGIWTNASSRTFKDAFAHVDALDVLSKVVAMPVQTWFYKDDHIEGRHMGPVAEDFAAMFELGNDNTHIGSVDESGVAFAAIQGLNKKVESENSSLKQENAALQTKLDDVLARLSKLEAGKGQ